MRKSLKQKRRSCTMCKAHKMHGARRWTDREFSRLRRDEREMREAVSR